MTKQVLSQFQSGIISGLCVIVFFVVLGIGFHQVRLAQNETSLNIVLNTKNIEPHLISIDMSDSALIEQEKLKYQLKLVDRDLLISSI